MSKEKQVEEIARWLCADCSRDVPCPFVPFGALCKTVWKRSEALYNAGYRKQEWISVDEKLPKPYMSVLVYMPGEAPHPTVREGFLTKHGAWYAGGFDRLPDEVVMWKEMPEAPKMKGGE